MVNSIFSTVQGLHPRRRAYNMSYRNDYTAAIGELVPVYFQDLIPNSNILIRTHALIRLEPLVAPIMDNIDYYIHFWSASRRILEGDQFTDMITGETPDEEVNLPYWTPRDVYIRLMSTTSGNTALVQHLVQDGSLFDMLGYSKELFYQGTALVGTGKLNARKFIFYGRLLMQWYTNENIHPWSGFMDDLDPWCNPKNEPQGNISNNIADFVRKIWETFGSCFFGHAWQADYFTKALPTLQYGEPVYLPLGQDAPVTVPIRGTDVALLDPKIIAQVGNTFDGETGLYTDSNEQSVSSVIVSQHPGEGVVDAPISAVTGSINAADLTGSVDLSEATAITINELRLTNALQVFKEREMRFGRRAPEFYKGFYGVRPADARLQIPQYIGGGRMPISISDIEQTSQTTEDSPQGNLSGNGTGIAGGFATGKVFVPEESCVIGLAWAMPKVTYSQLLSRHDTKLNDRFEYFNPSFVHIGEQEVRNYEIFAGSYGTATGDQEFGYQPRYTEYRFHANEMHGAFKNSYSFWTLGRIFDSQPALNSSFLYMRPANFVRVFAVQYTDLERGFVNPNMKVSLKFSVSLVQPLSRNGTPSLLV